MSLHCSRGHCSFRRAEISAHHQSCYWQSSWFRRVHSDGCCISSPLQSSHVVYHEQEWTWMLIYWASLFNARPSTVADIFAWVLSPAVSDPDVFATRSTGVTLEHGTSMDRLDTWRINQGVYKWPFDHHTNSISVTGYIQWSMNLPQLHTGLVTGGRAHLCSSVSSLVGNGVQWLHVDLPLVAICRQNTTSFHHQSFYSATRQ